MCRVDQENAERIDVLCNVAGGFMMGEGVAETSDETWDFLFNLNTKSVMHGRSCGAANAGVRVWKDH